MSASTERKNRAAARAAGTDKKMLAAQEAAEKARKSKRRWIIGTIAVVLCIALVLFLSSPIMYRITTAVSVGGKNYSPAQFNYMRASSKNQAILYGLDYSTLSSYFGEEYADELLDSYVNYSLTVNASKLQAAQEQGISLSAMEKSAIQDNVDLQMSYIRQYAKLSGTSVSTYMSYLFGAGVNANVIRKSMEEDALCNKTAFAKYCELSFSPEELAAYYADPSDGDMFSYAYFLVTEDEEHPGDDLPFVAADIADGFRDLWDGEVEAETLFTDLVGEIYPEQTPTVHNNVSGANLEESFHDWLTAEGRSKGDITSLEAPSGSGFYVLLFLDRTDNSEEVAAVRHILVKAVPSEDGGYTDEAKAEAKARAEEILAAYEKGEKTEADFATMASLLSEDSKTAADGGLYSAVTKGEMVEEFDAFCFADHQYGDTAIVYGESGVYAGYHVMFYVEKLPARDASARDALRSDAMNEWLTSLVGDLEPVQHWAYKLVG